jgi:hypothetical protein
MTAAVEIGRGSGSIDVRIYSSLPLSCLLVDVRHWRFVLSFWRTAESHGADDVGERNLPKRVIATLFDHNTKTRTPGLLGSMPLPLPPSRMPTHYTIEHVNSNTFVIHYHTASLRDSKKTHALAEYELIANFKSINFSPMPKPTCFLSRLVDAQSRP